MASSREHEAETQRRSGGRDPRYREKRKVPQQRALRSGGWRTRAAAEENEKVQKKLRRRLNSPPRALVAVRSRSPARGRGGVTR